MVRVYRNLTRQCWSVKLGGRVIAHVPAIVLSDVTLHVSDRARERVLRTRRREVHAWATGTVAQASVNQTMVEVGYSPWMCANFTSRPGFHSVLRASLIVFTTTGKAFAQID